jgi:hypothetical protein
MLRHSRSHPAANIAAHTGFDSRLLQELTSLPLLSDLTSRTFALQRGNAARLYFTRYLQ